jgi:hypothetical protein
MTPHSTYFFIASVLYVGTVFHFMLYSFIYLFRDKVSHYVAQAGLAELSIPTPIY